MIVSNGDLTIELRKATIRDTFKRESIVARLVTACGGGKAEEISYRIFARVGTQAVRINGANLSLPSDNDDNTALVEKWNAWIDIVTEDIENKLYSAFYEEMQGVDPATAPQPLTEDAPKN